MKLKQLDLEMRKYGFFRECGYDIASRVNLGAKIDYLSKRELFLEMRILHAPQISDVEKILNIPHPMGHYVIYLKK